MDNIRNTRRVNRMSEGLNGKRWLLAAFVVAALAACGGDDDDNGGKEGGLSYKGNTNPVLITDSNALSLSEASFSSSKTAETVAGNSSGNSRMSAYSVAAVNTDDGTTVEQGSCGGTVHQEDIEQNSETGAFTTIYTFFDYCEDGEIANGVMNMSGIIDPVTGEFREATIVMKSYQSRQMDGSESSTTEGTMKLASVESKTTFDMDLVIRDDLTNEMHKLENFSISESSQGGYEYLELNGRFYDSKEGYLDIETLEPFITPSGSERPSSGQMVMTGAKGAAGSETRIIMTAEGASYRIQVDTTGDGNFDFEETYPWEEEIAPEPDNDGGQPMLGR